MKIIVNSDCTILIIDDDDDDPSDDGSDSHNIPEYKDRQKKDNKDDDEIDDEIGWIDDDPIPQDMSEIKAPKNDRIINIDAEE